MLDYGKYIAVADYPQDGDNPLSYEHLEGDWALFYKVARYFTHKVKFVNRQRKWHRLRHRFLSLIPVNKNVTKSSLLFGIRICSTMNGSFLVLLTIKTIYVSIYTAAPIVYEYGLASLQYCSLLTTPVVTHLSNSTPILVAIDGGNLVFIQRDKM